MLFIWLIISLFFDHTLSLDANNHEWYSTLNANDNSRINNNLFETNNINSEIQWLILDLFRKVHPAHCYAFIFDAVYETVFSSVFFQNVKEAARFVIKVSQEEDTLDPRSVLKCALQHVRKTGCDGYVILLANGIQLERLLRYGDKTRVIDSRARFIILHHYHLFIPQLHYLWKRIVNVTFLRRVRRKISNVHDLTRYVIPNISAVYELSTVPFPIPIKGVFFTKIINFWESGKFRLKNDRIFRDKTADLGGQTMQVVLLEHTPAVFKSIRTRETLRHINGDDTNLLNNRPADSVRFSHIHYSGIEIELLKAISVAMHFKMNFYETHDAELEKWGTLNKNGTVTGLLQHMHEGRADFALADLHHTDFHLAFMDLTIPYNTECLTFLTPEALSDNSWKTLIMPFNADMWGGVLFSMLFVGFVFYAFSNALDHIHRHEKRYQPEYVSLQHRHHRNTNNATTTDVMGFRPQQSFCKKQQISTFKLSEIKCSRNNRKKHATKLLQISLSRTNKKLKKLRLINLKRKPESWHNPLPAKDIFHSFNGCIIYTYSMLLLISLPRLPKGWTLRVLTGWYWIYCVLVVVAYRASFTAILANPIPRLTIDTLEDLAESPIRCGASGEQNLLFFQKANDPHSHVIGAKLEHIRNPELAVKQVVEGMYAYYENIHLLRQLRSTQKSGKARQTLHIMKECVVNMPISIGLEKNSPIKAHVDRYIRALVEGGLTGKWLSDAIERFQSNVELPLQEATIDLRKMYAGIIAIVLGYTLSSIAFVVEKLYWKYFIESSPSFDKYLFGIQFLKHG